MLRAKIEIDCNGSPYGVGAHPCVRPDRKPFVSMINTVNQESILGQPQGLPLHCQGSIANIKG